MDRGLPSDVDELTVALGDLRVTVRRRLGATDREAPREESADAGDDGFELIEASEPDRPTNRDQQILAATTAEEFAGFDLPELRALTRRLRSSDLQWTPRARIVRAFRAGLAARNKLAGEWGAGTPRSPEVPFQARYYLALRVPGGEPFWTNSGNRFFARVAARDGRGFAHGVVCQSLPSEAEAEAFLLGAGRPWPAQQ